jgi:DNA adenine methylase
MFGGELYTNLKNLKIAHPNQDSARCLFVEMKDVINDKTKTDLERAVAFYIVNKCSFSGLTESSSFSAPEYSEIISHWHINSYSYEYCFENNIHDGLFMYLDPPYDIKDNLYGKKGAMHKSFDHDQFAEDCSQSSVHQLISYNSDQLVKDRFKGWKAGEFNLTYTMRSVGEYMKDQQTRKELLLFNYE